MRGTLLTAAGLLVALVAPVTPLAMAATVPADGMRVPVRGPSAIYKEVAKNLHNPRQIDFGRNGTMYVAEAGQGSFNGSSSPGPCIAGAEGTLCFGDTGSVTRLRHGHQHRVLKRLASLGGQADGGAALGPSDLVVVGRHTIVLSIGLGTDPATRRHLTKLGRAELAHLLSFDLRNSKRASVGDVGAHEARANPIAKPDSDPTGVVRAGKLGYLVTDSGGNTLVRAKNGHVHGVATFRSRGKGANRYQSVPTDVVKGPDGAWYVSELTGAPFIQGAARIWRIVPGHKPHVWASGLTNVTSIAFDGKRLYAVQIADAGLGSGGSPIGSLRRVFSKKSGKPAKPIATGLFAPYGVALHHGAAYVSICSLCSPTVGGSVIKIPLG
jgi:hypothetical protein